MLRVGCDRWTTPTRFERVTVDIPESENSYPEPVIVYENGQIHSLPFSEALARLLDSRKER